MPRTVRISPVPIPPPPVAPRARRGWTGPVGAALLVVAVVFAVGHVVASGSGDRSWDRHPTPPATVRLSAGSPYLLSTVDGPRALRDPLPLSCTVTPPGGQATALTLTEENSDSRATHAVARFVSPVSGTVAVTCTGGAIGARPVFVDDADDAGQDLATWLLLLCSVTALAGVGMTLGALYRRYGVTRVSGVTADPSA